jgi:hypothetical protein
MQNPYQSPQHASYRAGGNPAGESEYRVHCECGADVAVRASQAGGVVNCRCSRVVAVPRLSQLRTAAGQAAHETNIRDSIARMIGEQVLPWGQCCAVTEMPTQDVMWFDIHCETSYTRGGRVNWFLAVWSLLLPGGLFAMVLRAREQAENLGRDIVISVPVKVCDEKQSGLRRASQRYLRKLLLKVPVYHELFREHPYARILPK